MSIARKLLPLLLGLAIAFAAAPEEPFAAAAPAQESSLSTDDRYEHGDDCTKAAELTKEQEQALDNLFAKMHETNKALIEKYAEFGMLTDRQKRMKLDGLDHYVAHVKKHHFRWCTEYDDGEWEWDED